MSSTATGRNGIAFCFVVVGAVVVVVVVVASSSGPLQFDKTQCNQVVKPRVDDRIGRRVGMRRPGQFPVVAASGSIVGAVLGRFQELGFFRQLALGSLEGCFPPLQFASRQGPFSLVGFVSPTNQQIMGLGLSLLLPLVIVPTVFPAETANRNGYRSPWIVWPLLRLLRRRISHRIPFVPQRRRQRRVVSNSSRCNRRRVRVAVPVPVPFLQPQTTPRYRRFRRRRHRRRRHRHRRHHQQRLYT
mmetsp:Transcript_1491/g.3042  ORF Transcript_1491/g.3042 Transcript_1491/m.3042 type:complete len:244 (-) Transcript_1491:292-1023(-)